jgi:hypothetical protein
MSVNKFQPHVLVLPEDDANRQIANGFLLGLPYVVSHKIQVLPEAGGWMEVLDSFLRDHSAPMAKYDKRVMILLIDFDGIEKRLHTARASIPSHLVDRAFILGAWTEPEELKAANLGSYERIGLAMAKDCRENTSTIWSHDLLRHNDKELSRPRTAVNAILFPSTP